MDSNAKLATEKFLAYYEMTKALEMATKGRPLEEYKPTEPDRLMDAFAFILAARSCGKEFVADLFHELVWRQCLGNGNHRTTFLFVQSFLDSLGLKFPYYAADGSEDRVRNDISRFTTRSKEYLDRQSEWGYGPREFERRHAGMAKQTVEEWLGDQSFDWMTVGPQRLMDFISRSDMSG